MLSIKTINQLKKHYKEYEPEDDTQIKEPAQEMFLDECFIIGFVPKTKHIKQAFSGIFENESDPVKQPVKYDKSSVTVEFSLEYIKEVLKILTAADDNLNQSIKITLQKDHPVCFDLKEFKVYLACRKDVDDGVN